MKTEESGWLIEKERIGYPGTTNGLCLGVTDSGKINGFRSRVEWTSPHFALRFARKEDAEAAAKVLCPETGTIAVEHGWDLTPKP